MRVLRVSSWCATARCTKPDGTAGGCVIDRAMLVARRELSVERSQPDGAVTALTFTVTVVLLESLAFGAGRAHASDIASGLYWIALLFAAVLVATRSFDRELE